MHNSNIRLWSCLYVVWMLLLLLQASMSIAVYLLWGTHISTLNAISRSEAVTAVVVERSERRVQSLPQQRIVQLNDSSKFAHKWHKFAHKRCPFLDSATRSIGCIRQFQNIEITVVQIVKMLQFK